MRLSEAQVDWRRGQVEWEQIRQAVGITTEADLALVSERGILNWWPTYRIPMDLGSAAVLLIRDPEERNRYREVSWRVFQERDKTPIESLLDSACDDCEWFRVMDADDEESDKYHMLFLACPKHRTKKAQHAFRQQWVEETRRLRANLNPDPELISHTLVIQWTTFAPKLREACMKYREHWDTDGLHLILHNLP